MRTSPLMALGVVVALACPSISAAGSPPDTVVRLKNGDLARGTLVELVGGDHVTIILPTGETRLYKWDDVDTVKNEPLPVTTAAPPPAAPTTPPPPAPPPGASVHIVTNDDDAKLSRLAGSGEGILSVGGGGVGTVSVEVYDAVCHAPCDRFVPAGWYNMTGEGLLPSRQFEVRAGAPVTVNAHMASRGRLVGGRWGLFVGIPFALAGGVLLAFVASSKAFDPDPRTGVGGIDRTPMLAVGGVMLGLGVVGIGLGIYLLATAHSDVELTASANTNTVRGFVRRGFTLTF